MVEGAWVWGVRGGEWSVMRGDDGGGEDGGERIEVVVWHRERLDVHGEVGELSVKRGDVGGKEEVVERSEEEVDHKTLDAHCQFLSQQVSTVEVSKCMQCAPIIFPSSQMCVKCI